MIMKGACGGQLLRLVLLLQLVLCSPDWATATTYEDDGMHPHDFWTARNRRSVHPVSEIEEESAAFWIAKAQKTLEDKVLKRRVNENVAKNVIMFLGDGMSIPTITAARIHMGGEMDQLAFEEFPYIGLSKTYCVDKQVPDSACTATAYLTGVKANFGTIGVTAAVKRADCPAMTNSTLHVPSIARKAQERGKLTGLVTTARVTHASPAGLYAHTAERDWENDGDVTDANYDPLRCPDIARQLVEGETGRLINVVLGGGRSNFLPNISGGGHRLDGRNLIEEWVASKPPSENCAPLYISSRQELRELLGDPGNSLALSQCQQPFLLGLFNGDHMSYNLKRDQELEPTLSEMTEMAIRTLSQSENGYFLFVEGAKIDMGHHLAQARLALDETVEFSRAISKAMELADSEDTLVVVTSDHAHTLSMSGYADRGDDVLGIAGEDSDKMQYLILNYANGPGFHSVDGQGMRHDVGLDKGIGSPDYKYPGVFPMRKETHGGDDVAIFAQGPWAHLFSGVMEENVLPHLMSFASCLGDGLTACNL